MDTTLQLYLKERSEKISQHISRTKINSKYIKFISRNDKQESDTHLITLGQLLEFEEFKADSNTKPEVYIQFAIADPDVLAKERNEIYYYYSPKENKYYNESGDLVDILNQNDKSNWVVGIVEIREIVKK